MRIGVILPQTELGSDAGAVRAYAEGVESFGFSHILCYDHVLGADPSVHLGFEGGYDLASTFHEPFVLYGFLAAITRLELVTGILILPQRQTALVAKQAAEVDLLSGGRFRLGVGLGWNAVEYAALDKSFANRGVRFTEQIALLRALWTTPSLTFSGEFEQVVGAGIAPLPVQRPIPVWIGATKPVAIRRAGEIADGWFAQRRPGTGFEEDRAIFEQAARAAGRDPAAIGIEGRVNYDSDLDNVVAAVGAWRTTGLSHLTVDTMKRDLGGVDGHLHALRKVATALGLS